MRKFFEKMKTFVTENKIISILIAAILVVGIACAIVIPIASDKPDHVHGYESKWTAIDDEYHWHASTCGHKGKDTAKHNWQQIEGTNATCEEDGKKIFRCAECGRQKEETIPAVGHDYQTKEVIEPACEEDGYTILVCSNCNSEKKDEIKPATGHNFKLKSHVEATCEEDGNEITECANCGAKQEKIISKLGHNYELINHTDATCTKGETEVYKCSRCGDTYEKEISPALQHDISADAEAEWISAEGETCVYYIAYPCKRCKEAIPTGETVEKHDYVYSIKTPATCRAAGEKLGKCENCGKEETEELPIVANAHNWEETERNDSKVTYRCSVCDEVKTVIDASDKKETTITGEDVKTAEINVNEAAMKFDDTTSNLIEEEVTISANTLTEDEKADLGLTDDQKSQISGEIYDFAITKANGDTISDFNGGKVTITLKYTLSEGESIDNIAVWFISADGTLTAIRATYYEINGEGYVTFETSHFSRYTVTRLTAKERCELYGHNFKTRTVEATCTTDGYTLAVCVRCKAVEKRDIVEATGHHYEENRTEPTCEKDGSSVKTCAKCGDEQREVLPKLGHNMVDGVCTRCKMTCEHEFEVSEEVEATCVTDGYTEYTCTKCGTTKRENVVKAPGHKYVDGVCEVCGEKVAGEEDYYLNMLKTLAEKRRFAIKLTDLSIESEDISKLLKDGESIFETTRKTTIKQLDITEIILALNEDGALEGTATGSITVESKYRYGTYVTAAIKAVIKDGYTYVYVNAEQYENFGVEMIGEVFMKLALENIPTLFNRNSDPIPLDEIEEILKLLENNLGEIPEGLIKKGNYFAVQAQKLLLDMFFEKSSTEGDNVYALTFNKLSGYVDKLGEKKISAVIDYFLGENTSAGLTKFIPAILNTTLSDALSKLEEKGINYKKILSLADDIARISGNENVNISESALKFIESAKDRLLKDIIAEMAQTDETQITKIAEEVTNVVNNRTLVDLLFIIDDENLGEKENFIPTLKKAVEYLNDIFENQSITFSTDVNGFITSIDMNFDHCLVSSSGYSTDIDIGEKSFMSTYYLSGNISILTSETPVIGDYEKVINEIEAKKLKFAPNSTIEVKSTNSTIYNLSRLVIETDEDGEVLKITETGLDNLNAFTAVYDFDRNAVICLTDQYCGNTVMYSVMGMTTKTYLSTGSAIREYRSFQFYYDPVTHKVIEEDDIGVEHDFEIIEEESDLRCGGSVTEKCRYCDAIRTRPIIHNGELVETYKLIDGATSCTEGVIITYSCSECHAELGKSFDNFHYLNKDSEKYSLKDYGGTCDTYIIVKRCACGERYEVSIEGDCDFSSRTEYFNDECLQKSQKQVDGDFYPYHYSGNIYIQGNYFGISSDRCYVYKCAVTNTSCKAELTVKIVWRKEANCTAKLHLIILAKKDGNDKTIIDEVIDTHTYHDYVRSEDKSSVTYTCKDCGSYYTHSSKSYTDGEYDVYEEKTVIENTLKDGQSKKREEKTVTRSNNGDYYYRKYTEIKTDSEGNKTEYYEETVNEPYSDIPEPFINGYHSVQKNSEGFINETIYAVYKDYRYTILEYRHHPDGYWNKYEYSYDFTCCLKTTTHTDSSLLYNVTKDSCHQLYNPSEPSKHLSCSQVGYVKVTCRVCENYSEYDRIEPDHYWEMYDGNTFICAYCGLMNTNGASGRIIMEDLTDYDNGDDYIVGYYKRTDADFTPNITLVRKTFKDDENDELYLDLEESAFIFTTDPVVAVKVSKALVEEYAAKLLASLGLNREDYFVKMSFVPDDEGDGSLDYAITFEPIPKNVYDVSETCVVKYSISAGEKVSITITATESTTWKIMVLDRNSDAYCYAELKDENGYSLDSGSYMYAHLEEGYTYTLTLEWSDESYSGDVITAFFANF